jgi:hypothetical protein
MFSGIEAKAAGTHLRRSYGRQEAIIGVVETEPGLLEAMEEEKLVFENRPAHGVTELVAAVRRARGNRLAARRQSVGIIEERIGVELLVLQELIRVSVQGVGAVLGLHQDHGAAGSSELG